MLLDSNIVIGYLNGDQIIIDTLTTWRENRQTLFISTITVAEVLALPNLTDKELAIIQSFLDTFIVFPLDKSVAVEAALLKRQYRLTLPDAIIAASAVALDVPLVSHDEIFKKVDTLTVLTIG